MPADGRDDQVAELASELAREADELANGETLEQLEVTIDELRQLRQRVEQRQIEPDDWALLRTLVQEEMR